ncbi:Hypothetical protein A7982_06002 [Minicystis rosea]|nr:Hypothetical protein A7982_06002 [Minicystis rosea]
MSRSREKAAFVKVPRHRIVLAVTGIADVVAGCDGLAE